MGVTLKEIAQISGFSKSTVERALNNGKGVNEQTQKKVLTVAKQLGYKTNIAGKMLSQNGRKRRVGIIIPSSNLGREVMVGMKNAEQEFLDMGVEFIEQTIEDHSVSALLNALSTAQTDDWEIVVVRLLNSQLVVEKVNELVESGIEVITYNAAPSHVKMDTFIGQDCVKAGKTAAGLLKSCTGGQGKVLLINGWKRWQEEQQRYEGFLEQLRETEGLSLVGTMHMDDVPQNQVWDSLSDMVCSFLQKHREVNGIYSAEGSESCLFAICSAIDRCGLDHKIHVVGHDSYPTNKQLLVSGKVDFLIDQQFYTQGYMAIKMAVYRILHHIDLPKWVKTNIQIVVKENLEEFNHTFNLF